MFRCISFFFHFHFLFLFIKIMGFVFPVGIIIRSVLTTLLRMVKRPQRVSSDLPQSTQQNHVPKRGSLIVQQAKGKIIIFSKFWKIRLKKKKKDFANQVHLFIPFFSHYSHNFFYGSAHLSLSDQYTCELTLLIKKKWGERLFMNKMMN
ncbi:hypothetical protein BDA99DRAFT_193191 [Phascolomyces articulosus]|uniref:Uncharacterized protein n=1 Tax=Phascolomyces articulosus TaxID=60185 RepID=A0AAD5PJ12_9FUNG|nr:hypothetical protein BDA99DRAFT_193191 [Phascolomyces articulosus]